RDEFLLDLNVRILLYIRFAESERKKVEKVLGQKSLLRASMWYNFKQGKSAAESHRAISEVYGDEALLESQGRRWYQRFKNGNESLEDEEHGSRPQFVDNQVLKTVIKLDPH
ncbi:hypothetical protein V3C99_017782, partial [Haemonchus contortus]